MKRFCPIPRVDAQSNTSDVLSMHYLASARRNKQLSDGESSRPSRLIRDQASVWPEPRNGMYYTNCPFWGPFSASIYLRPLDKEASPVGPIIVLNR
ncbi:uncharacterized protein BO96DRAFT_349345 [Aspergillus niger CBS 101883]|uniref:uncharacterized protein n=1 Tax=Aspergillus lacticoffeatus (strain CBS 101883) TaxID=1450533 RepID=UPI000D7FB324|nr:uncharacterized protein BO96DRAFT_349345 [Aspergillus niger CBS 101883]PYH51771.1 hypothetical protein BO96DRAFT_349345 [Aspergillus niger CBS 101883]